MKRISAALLTACLINTAFAANPSAVGYWKTIDDVTGKPKAIIQITQAQDHTLHGQILKIFPRPGYDQNERCTECKGAKHNQRMVGMLILENLKPSKEDAGHWSGGEILDPNNGKNYHCTLQLANNNQKLNVRGYIGIPLLGRTQTWNRVDEAGTKT